MINCDGSCKRQGSTFIKLDNIVNNIIFYLNF